MSSIDERVVKMEFDNQEFEQNANTTMSTLEKLKSALKFDGLGKSVGQLSDAAKKLDLSNLSDSAGVVTAKFSAMQVVGYTAIANLTNRLLNFAYSTVRNTFAQVVQGGLNRAFNIEKAKFAIEGLGKSFKKLDADITYAVKGTAYGYDEAARAASSMVASGVKAGKEMKTALRSISGMAAMTGSSYSEIADIFTTVAGNGRVLTQQLNQLSSRGINAAAVLRDYINKHEDLRKNLIEEGLKKNKKAVEEFKNAAKLTEKNIRSLVSTGVVGFDTFSTAIDDAFGEHAKAANRTFNGVVSNIKASLSRIGAAFAQPLIANNQIDNMLKYVDTSLRDALNTTKRVAKSTKQTKKDLYEALASSGKFSTKLIEALKKTKEFSGKTTEEIREAFAKDPEGMLKSVHKIKEYSKVTKKELKGLFTTTTKDLRYLYKQNAKDFLDQAKEVEGYAGLTKGKLSKLMRTTKEEFIHQVRKGDDLVKVLQKTKEYSGKSAKEIRKAFKEDSDGMLKVVQKVKGYSNLTEKELGNLLDLNKRYANKSDKELGNLFDKYYKVQYNLVGVLQAVMNIFVAVEKKITGSKFLQNFHKKASKICKALILLFNGIATTIGGIQKKSGKFMEVIGDKKHLIPVTKIWEKLRKTLGLSTTSWEKLINVLKGFGAIFDIIKYVVGEAINVFKPTKEEASSFAESLLDVASEISNVIQAFSKWIQESGIVHDAFVFIKNTVKSVINIFKPLVKLVVDVFKWISKGQKPIKNLGSSIKKIFDAFKRLTTVLTDSLVSVFKKFIGLFVGEDKEVKSASDIFESAITVVCNVLSWFVDHIAGFIDGIASFIDEFNVIETICGPILWLAGIITNNVVPALKNLWGIIKNFVGDKMKSFTEWLTGKTLKGDNIFTSMKDSFKKGTEDFKPDEFIEKVKKKILDGFDAIANFDYGAAFDKIKNGFDNFVDYLGDVREKIGKAYDKVKKTLEEKNINFESIGEKLQKGFDNAFTIFIDNAPKAVDAVVKFFVNIFDTIRKKLPSPQNIAEPLAGFIVSIVESLVNFIPWIIETLTMTIQIIADDLGNIIESLTEQLGDILSKATTSALIVGKGKNKRQVRSISDSLTDTIKSAAENIDWDTILKTIKTLVNVKLALNAGGFFKSGSKLFDTISNGINRLLGNFENEKQHEQKMEKLAAIADIIKNLAILIGVIAGAIIVLGLIPVDKLQQGFWYFIQIIAAIGAFAIVLTGLDYISETAGSGKLNKLFGGIAELAKGLAKIIGSLILLAIIPFKEGAVEAALAQVGILLTEIGVFILAITKISPSSLQLEAVGASIESIGKGVKQLVEAIVILSLLDTAKSWEAIMQIAALLFALTGAIQLLSKSTKGFDYKALFSVLPAILLLGSIVAALLIIKKYELDVTQLYPILGAIAVLTGIVFALSKIAKIVTNPKDVLGVLALLGIMLGMLVIVIGALWVIKAFELDPMGLVWISLSLLIMAGVIAALGLIGTADPVAGMMAALQLVEFIGILTMLLLALGALSTNEKIKTLIQNGGEMLRLIGEMLAQVVVGFINGVKTAIENLMGMEIDETQVDKINKVADMLAKLAKVQSVIEKGGGKLLSFFAGDKPFTKFGNGVVNLFESFKAVGEAAGEIENIDKIESIAKVSKTLADIVEAIKDPSKLGEILNLVGENKLATLAKELGKFAEAVKDYVDKFEDIDTSKMSKATNEVAKSINKLAKASSNEKFTKGFSSTGENAVEAITSGFEGSSGKIASALSSQMSAALESITTTSFKNKGQYCMRSFIAGLKVPDVATEAKDIAKKAVDGMSSSDIVTKAKTSGGNVSDGFTNGIKTKAKLDAAYSAGYRLGERALDGIKDAIAEGSPSRKAKKSGVFVGEGFAIGIRHLSQKVFNAGKNMGDNAINGIKKSISNINSMISSDLSEPTIRPVLDLSNVKMGMNSIDSIFNDRYAIGVSGDLTANGVRSAASRPINVSATFNVNGTDDPKYWADEFVNELRIQERTYNG